MMTNTPLKMSEYMLDFLTLLSLSDQEQLYTNTIAELGMQYIPVSTSLYLQR